MSSSSLAGDTPSQARANAKPKHLELPTPGLARERSRPTPAPSHLLPATALFHGPNSRNASHTSLNRARDRDDRTTGTPIDTPGGGDRTKQHLPRAMAPTKSFSGVARPSLIGEHKLLRGSHLKHTGGVTTGSSKKEDDFRADAVWAEMQKTLADVELSAMNSSHVFSSTHAKALEDLRSAQLGLSMAWAKSEADEAGNVDEEFGRDDQGSVGQMKGSAFSNNKDSAASPASGKQQGHSRQGSNASNSGRGGDLEEETERDIRLARRRREANDRYFKQVNNGVVDVVKKLEEVVGAMRRVERESREIWNEQSGSGSGSGSADDDLGEATETDESLKKDKKGRGRARTTETGIGTESEALTDSPTESRR